MIYIKLFLAFFIPGIVGYGGGPATIPLIEKEVVSHYGWMSTAEFSSMLGIANAIPGPIAPKLAGYIGYHLAGFVGAVITLFATIAPTVFLMIVLLNILLKYRDSQRVKRLSAFVMPVVAVLMLQLTWKFLDSSYELSSWLPTILIALCAYFTLEKLKWNPAIVIVLGLFIGGLFLS